MTYSPGVIVLDAISKPDSSVTIATGTSTNVAAGLTPDASLIVSSIGIWSSDGRQLAIFTRNSRDDHGFEEVVISSDGRAGATVAHNDAASVSVWDLALEDRSPVDSAQFVAAHVPWRVEQGRLVSARP